MGTAALLLPVSSGMLTYQPKCDCEILQTELYTSGGG